MPFHFQRLHKSNISKSNCSVLVSLKNPAKWKVLKWNKSWSVQYFIKVLTVAARFQVISWIVEY